MVDLKTPTEIEAMRAAGKVVAAALTAVRTAAAVGVSLCELDEVARDVLRSAGAVSLFEGYQPGFAPAPFSGVICTSVNDAVLHGLPTGTRLADGDLLNVDCGASLDGWCADSATSFVVGTPRPEDLDLIATTERALAAGIAAAVAGARLGDIGAAIGEIGDQAAVGTNLDFGGHGIGRRMHEEPHIPNGGRPGRGLKLRPGHVFAIEPWFWHGTGSVYVIDDDGWTLRSADHTRGAHAEHTVAVTEDGPQILTLR
ncbi:methionine aminopeptidase, type I [Kribbella flavida DSM 17836]|uniref:Methionine aminopeptidase n=1 Tax=Kribbella flavida (strain DSM 17836 / JCM 10339 / NBRC 14399) TaxID=479435 RepID=D2PSV1_KRIFD|nr:type I methionyl aminopeptidase [Kribbella flavida]ADB35003.1 methionine aminopeptidase, type I [Kribbella flavida DSM 17836]